MAEDLNVLTVRGRLTADPDLFYTPSNLAIGSATIAINGRKDDDTCFIDLKFFGATAENFCKFFGKGSQLIAIGRLQQEKWKDKTTNENRYKHVLNAHSFIFCGKKEDNEGANVSGPPATHQAPANGPGPESHEHESGPQQDIDLTNIPF